jgi:hypothetical protein
MILIAIIAILAIVCIGIYIADQNGATWTITTPSGSNATGIDWGSWMIWPGVLLLLFLAWLLYKKFKGK